VPLAAPDAGELENRPGASDFLVFGGGLVVAAGDQQGRDVDLAEASRSLLGAMLSRTFTAGPVPLVSAGRDQSASCVLLNNAG
jgi:hypothetical protein